ncbi:MAG: hypothetical protein R2685_06265 [Candidatus Nitrosocosmicus sp.]|nr:hypothetical protein [Candidatus Nitrosocosmicus sp.]
MTTKITIATSDETADWIITIPTLGGNQIPVFEDLEQTISDKTLDDVTLTGTVTLHSTSGDYLEFVKPHADGAKEMLAKWRLDEVSTSYLSIENANATNDIFVPSFWFKKLES